MKRDLKIIWWVVFVLLIVLVCYMMFWWTSFRNDDIQDQIQTWEIENIETEVVQEDVYDFEQDTAQALEDFFKWGEWYEYLEGEYWFTSSDFN